MSKGLIFVLLAIIFATSVYATASLNFPTVALGGPSQERNKNASTSVTITNTGDVTLSNLTFSTNADAKYGVTFSGSCINAQLASGGTCTLTTSASVPKDFDAVDSSSLQEKAFLIGTITASANYSSGNGSVIITTTTNLTLQAENQLELRKVKVIVNGIEDSVSDGDTVRKIKPGDEIDIEITVKNNFDDSKNDVTIENVEVKAKVDDNDLDIDESEDIGDLDADDSDTISFNNLLVDEEADGTYDLVISATGRDENGALHADKMTVKLKVERETHEIKITKALLTNSKLACVEGSITDTTARISFVNIGKRDEKEVAISASIDKLGITARKDGIELEKDDSSSISLLLDIPDSAKAGTYDVTVTSYYNNDVPSDTKTIPLQIEKCEQPQNASTTTTATPTTPTAPTTTATTQAITTPTIRLTEKAQKSTPFTETPAYLWLLGGISAGIVIVIFQLISKLLLVRK
ncbi:MAG: hypothetical protein QXN89_02185 [Candidatus Woesearchaeota archaeon]